MGAPALSGGWRLPQIASRREGEEDAIEPRLWELALEDGIVCGLGCPAEILVALCRFWSRRPSRPVELLWLLLLAGILIVVLHVAAASGEDIIPFAAVGASIFTHSFNYLSFGLLFQLHRRAQVQRTLAREDRGSDKNLRRPPRELSELTSRFGGYACSPCRFRSR